MNVLKSMLLVMVFVLLGVLIGLGAFWTTQHYANQANNSAALPTTDKKSLASQPAVSSVQRYEDPQTHTSFTLPTGFKVVEASLILPVPTRELQLIKEEGQRLTKANIELYSLDKTGKTTAEITRTKASLKRFLLASWQYQDFANSVNKNIISKQYTSTSEATLTTHELENDSYYVLVLEQSNNDQVSALSRTETATLLNSLSDSMENPTASPSPSSSPSATISPLLP